LLFHDKPHLSVFKKRPLTLKTLAPHSRLLFGFAIVFFPLATLSTIYPSFILLTISALSVTSALIFIDAVFAQKCFDGIHIKIPDIIRLSKNRTSVIDIHITNSKKKTGKLRVGLSLPEYIISTHQDIYVLLSKHGESFTIYWPCTSAKQGRIIIDHIYLEMTSPLSFWLKRSAVPVSSEIRTYPNLLIDRKDVAAVLMNRNLGIHSQRQIGKGRDFEQLREYLPGDNYEDIHWKATAKRGSPTTKIYQIERTQEIYIIIDASRLSTRYVQSGRNENQPNLGLSNDFQKGSLNETIFERFVNAALILGLTAERQGDLFGLLSFTDQVRGFIKAKTGKSHFNACRDMLYTLEPQVLNPDFHDLFAFLGSKIRKRSLLLFFTSLDDPALSESFLDHIHLLTRKHIVLVNMIKPAGTQPIFSTSDVATTHDVYAALGNHFVWESLKETEKLIQRHGAGFNLLDNEKICAQVISQYMNIKKRQIL